jgi:hypothetical protein
VPCHIEAMGPIGVGFRHPIILLPVGIRSTVSRSMGPSLAQAEEGFHGVAAAGGVLVAGEGSVVGGNKRMAVAWGPSAESNGDQSKSLGRYLLKVDPHYSLCSGRYQYSSLLKTF